MLLPLHRFSIMVISIFLALVIFGSLSAEEKQSKPLAKSDFFTITQDDLSLLRSRMKSFFETTEKEYCRALLKINLFAKQAIMDGIDKEPEIAAELKQMVEHKLSDIYINRMLADYELLPGTVTSYYDSHPDKFTLADGTLAPLDEALRKKIKNNIMQKKKSEIANKEMARLMKKYDVDIINPVCEDKGLSNE